MRKKPNIVDKAIFVHEYTILTGKNEDETWNKVYIPFFVGGGGDYEYRRYTNRPTDWNRIVDARQGWFTTELLCHGVDEQYVKKMIAATVWYFTMKGYVLLNEVVEPTRDILIDKDTNIYDYYDTIFNGRYLPYDDRVFLSINTGKRNYHRRYRT